MVGDQWVNGGRSAGRMAGVNGGQSAGGMSGVDGGRSAGKWWASVGRSAGINFCAT